jgi:hypothetical protein
MTNENSVPPSQPVQKKTFGINKETKTSNPLAFPNAGIFSNVVLKKVYIAEKEMKDNTIKKCLAFLFVSPQNQRYEHLEWPIEPGEDNIDKKSEALASRVGHIVKAYIGAVPDDLGEADTFEGFANEIVNFFNKIGEGKTKTFFEGVKVHIKLVYDRKNNLGFPRYGLNFIEKQVPNVKTTIFINPRYDKIAASSAPSYSGGGENTGGGSYGGSDDDLPEM